MDKKWGKSWAKMEQLEVFEAGEGFAFGEAALLYNVRAPRASCSLTDINRMDGFNFSMNLTFMNHDELSTHIYIYIYPQ